MTTAAPPPSHDADPSVEPMASWDVGRLSHALDATPEITLHPVYGHGLRYRLGKDKVLTVDLFPPVPSRRTGIASFSAPGLELVLFHQPMPVIVEDSLGFPAAGQAVLITALGEHNLFKIVDE